MVNVVHRATSLTQRQQVAYHLNNVLPGEHAHLKRQIEAELGVQFQSTNA